MRMNAQNGIDTLARIHQESDRASRYLQQLALEISLVEHSQQMARQKAADLT